MPILLTNPAHRRAWEQALAADPTAQAVCSCGVSAAGNAESKMKRYYGSMDYNAGRHQSTQSQHVATCLCWEPPSTGHLHSWRRGYNDLHKK